MFVVFKSTSSTEMDGSPISEFFTVLNSSPSYTEDQEQNIFNFSTLNSWLSFVHNPKHLEEGQEEVPNLE